MRVRTKTLRAHNNFACAQKLCVPRTKKRACAQEIYARTKTLSAHKNFARVKTRAKKMCVRTRKLRAHKNFVCAQRLCVRTPRAHKKCACAQEMCVRTESLCAHKRAHRKCVCAQEICVRTKSLCAHKRAHRNCACDTAMWNTAKQSKAKQSLKSLISAISLKNNEFSQDIQSNSRFISWKCWF